MAEETPETDVNEQPSAKDSGTESEGAAVNEAETPEVTPVETPAEAPAVTGPEGAAEAEEVPPAPAEEKRPKRRLPRRLRPQRTKRKHETATARKPITRTPKQDSTRGRRQERRGIVVSDKGDKTIVVSVDVTKLHPRYKKVVRRTRKFHAHDEQNSAAVGDVVRIVETRPVSKSKRWRLAEVVEAAK